MLILSFAPQRLGPGGGLGCLEGLEEEFSPEELRELDSEGRAVLTLHETEV